MRDYEITFIVDPVLSGEEIKATAQTYVDLLTEAGCEIVHVEETGLRTLAYPINKRNSGVYFTIEFRGPNGAMIDDTELAFRRDERVMRFLTVKLDKFGVQYNEDKRNGKIAKAKKPKSKSKDSGRRERGGRDNRRGGDKPADKKPATDKKPAEANTEAAPAATEEKKES